MGKKDARSDVRGGKVFVHNPGTLTTTRKVKGKIGKAIQKQGSKHSKGIAKSEITPAALALLSTTSEVTSPMLKAENGTVDGKKAEITPSVATYLASGWELKDLVTKGVNEIYEGMLAENPPPPATGTEVEKFKRPCVRAVRPQPLGQMYVRSGRYIRPKPVRKGFRPVDTSVSVCDAGDQVLYSNAVTRI